MELAVELRSRGSRPAEMSDEGMMTADIEECLGVVLEALRKADLPAAEVIAWCARMLEHDRSVQWTPVYGPVTHGVVRPTDLIRHM
jgi:hypothetical protein